MIVAEVTVFEKRGGPLRKRFHVSSDGSLGNDDAACRMLSGTARRAVINSAGGLASLINGLSSSQAYAIGRLHDSLASTVNIVMKVRATGNRNAVARSKQNLIFAKGLPGVALLDIDLKGMPDAVKARIKHAGGIGKALDTVIPELATTARVARHSTSFGLSNNLTGEKYPGSGGLHVAIFVADSADIPRFILDLHNRLWLAGFGWGWIGSAGQFLERSLIDKAVGSPERLIFEGPPIIEPPLAQEGNILDTGEACPSLTHEEKGVLVRLIAAERERLKPESDDAYAQWSAARAEAMVAKGAKLSDARLALALALERQELSGAFPLTFDDRELAGATVADVIAAPDKYLEKTLADPIEGVAYGHGKAKLFRREDGDIIVHSFAHGGCKYWLRGKATAFAEPKAGELYNFWQPLAGPTFPVEILPRPVYGFVTKGSEVIGVDPSAMAVAALTVISGAIDHRSRCRMKLHDDWGEHVRLWSLLVGDPSSKKSPCIAFAMNPLKRRQSVVMRQHAEAKKALKARAKGVKKDEQEDPPDEPARYVINDTTIPKLEEILARSPRGSVFEIDEATGWILGLERWNHGADRARALQLWNGGAHDTDRIARDNTHVENFSASILGGAQPDRLAEIDGLQSDGLLQRFLPCLMRDPTYGADIDWSAERRAY